MINLTFRIEKMNHFFTIFKEFSILFIGLLQSVMF